MWGGGGHMLVLKETREGKSEKIPNIVKKEKRKDVYLRQHWILV